MERAEQARNGSNAQVSARPLLVILGPTAIGKSAISLELAAEFGGEVVSADSRLFYRGMDIGTDKPDPEELLSVPHHLIDVCWPDQTLNLGEYLRAATGAINAIHRRDRLPLLVGGTGQYIRAIVEGWSVPEVPPHEPLRDALVQLGEDELGRWLRCLDPESYQRIDLRNLRRVIRALEVTLISGQPFSHLQRKVPPDYAIKVVGLTCERGRLYDRIDNRIDQMITDGLLDEVMRLRESGYGRDLPAMSGLGYSQLQAFIDGELTFEEAIERIKFETHRFARQQYSWFRSYHLEICWFDVLEEGWQSGVDRHIREWLEILGNS